jgi:hypothetical protein
MGRNIGEHNCHKFGVIAVYSFHIDYWSRLQLRSRPTWYLFSQLFVLWLLEHLSDSFSLQPHFFTLLFRLMRGKLDHCEKKVLRGIKLDSKKHFEPKSVPWAGPTSRQLSKHYSWRQTRTQVQFYAACLLVVICTVIQNSDHLMLWCERLL